MPTNLDAATLRAVRDRMEQTNTADDWADLWVWLLGEIATTEAAAPRPVTEHCDGDVCRSSEAVLCAVGECKLRQPPLDLTDRAAVDAAIVAGVEAELARLRARKRSEAI